MFEPGQFEAITYWFHVVLGFGSALFGPCASLFFGALAWKDIQFPRTDQPDKPRRIKRHGF